MEKKYTVGLVLMALLAMTMSVSANVNTVNHVKGVAANAEWFPAPGGGFAYIDVSQNTPKGTHDMVTNVFVETCDVASNCGLYSGTVPNSVFNVKGMGSPKEADLSSVTLPLLFSFGGSPPPTITVDAVWTGVGDITKSSFESKSISGNLITRFAYDTSVRSATAIGSDSVHGALGTTSFANLFNFREFSQILTKP